MTDLATKTAELQCRAHDRQDFRAALADVETATREESAALAAFNVAVTLHGEESDVAQRASDAVGSAHKAADRARGRLAPIPAPNPTGAARKVLALLSDAMSPDTVAAIRADLSRILERPADPVVDLVTRYRRLHDFLSSVPVHPIGAEDPAIQDAYEAQTAIVRQLEGMTPTTPEGLAALADVAWLYDHGEHTPGSEGWEHAVTMDADARLMSRLRHGAHLLARR